MVDGKPRDRAGLDARVTSQRRDLTIMKLAFREQIPLWVVDSYMGN